VISVVLLVSLLTFLHYVGAQMRGPRRFGDAGRPWPRDGGYSTALYFGLGLGSFALGPVITHHGYSVGFAAGGAAGVIGALAAAVLWSTAARRSEDADAIATSGA